MPSPALATARSALRLIRRLAGDVRIRRRRIELTVFACFTSPLSPGLRTRTEMFWFVGWLCEAPESALQSDRFRGCGPDA